MVPSVLNFPENTQRVLCRGKHWKQTMRDCVCISRQEVTRIWRALRSDAMVGCSVLWPASLGRFEEAFPRDRHPASPYPEIRGWPSRHTQRTQRHTWTRCQNHTRLEQDCLIEQRKRAAKALGGKGLVSSQWEADSYTVRKDSCSSSSSALDIRHRCSYRSQP